jgi:hypothetical protein
MRQQNKKDNVEKTINVARLWNAERKVRKQTTP